MLDRHEERHELNLTCQVRSRPGQSQCTIILPRRTTIKNLSISGCALQSPRMPFNRSDHILLNIGEVEPIEAEVKWSRVGEVAGLCFVQSLNSADIEGIAHAVRHEAGVGRKSRKALRLDALARSCTS